MKKYDILGIVKMVFSLLYTKIYFPQAKIIRLPFDIRNKKFMQIGKNFTTGFGCRIEAYPENLEKVLSIGDNVQLNDYVHITAMKKVIVGNNVLMASKIYISDCSHGSYSGDKNDSHPNVPPSDRKLFAKEVIINDNVWLGEFVSVLPGVTIGKGTIVGANSVVSMSLPEYVIAVGSPAKPIKKFDFESKQWISLSK
jgi:acetyltransferase-like isoleucine patch superfamily enzyme